MRACAKWRTMLAPLVVAAFGVLLASPAMAICGGAHGPPSYLRCQTECFENYEQLMDELTRPTRRSQTFRIVQGRNGQPAPIAVHNQYPSACFFFAVAPILDYLGYSRFQHQGHYPRPFLYRANDGLRWYDLDVGYRGSPEDLMQRHLTVEAVDRTVLGSEGSEIYPCDFFAADSASCDQHSPLRLAINETGIPCAARFNSGQEYGTCQTLAPPASADTYPKFLDPLGAGCDGQCPCSADATCGALYFLNRSSHGAGGCRDALNFNLAASTSAERNAVRRIIRGFIDNNVPLLAGVNSGGHWIPIIGYADLDARGLPETAIAADSVEQVYWLVDLKVWNFPERYSLIGISPWNQHLDRGCEAGGWGRKLEDTIRVAYGAAIANKYRLCGAPSACGNDRYYGGELLCERDTDRDGKLDQRERYFVYEDDLFISEKRSIRCDRLSLRWRDGRRSVAHSRVYRFNFNADLGRWVQRSTSPPDEAPVIQDVPPVGRMGPASQVVWDREWSDGDTLVQPAGSSGDVAKRTTVYLKFDDDEVRTIEIAPPRTYGVEVTCLQEQGMSAAAEPGGLRYSVRHVFREPPARSLFRVDRSDHDQMNNVPLATNVGCDALSVTVRLGTGASVASAEAQLFYYGAAGRWQPEHDPWLPDDNFSPDERLSGGTKTFFWSRKWDNGSWLAAHNVGSGANYGDRKTVIRLRDTAGRVTRVIEFVPQVGQWPPAAHPGHVPAGTVCH